MQNAKCFLLSVCLLVASTTLSQTPPPIQWQKCLGGTGDDQGLAFQQTVDGGYIMAGASTSNNGDVSGNHGNSYDCWIVKLDAARNVLWQKSLGGSNTEFARSVQQTTDGGYIVAGYTISNDGNVTGLHPGAYDCWVVKLTATGSVQWQKCLGGSNGDLAFSILQTTDGGYIMAGMAGSNDGDVSGNHPDQFNNYGDAWIVKLNAAGSIQWQKCLGGSGSDWAQCLVQTADGGYIMSGYTTSNNGDVSGNHSIDIANTDAWVVKLNAAGSIQWQKCLGGDYNEVANSVQATADAGYIVAGHTTSNNDDVSGNHSGNSNYDAWVVKLNASGSIQWQKCLGGTFDEMANSIQQTIDGGYIVAGHATSSNGDVSGNHSSYSDSWVVKLNSTGNIEWQKCLGGTNYEAGVVIKQNTDGSYVVAGGSDSNNDGDVSGNHGGGDYWIVKLGSVPTGLNNITSSLHQVKVFPNPGSGNAIISFFLEKPENVSAKIFDANGRMIKLLADAKFGKGQYELKWNTAEISAGIYFLQFDAGVYSTTKTISLIK